MADARPDIHNSDVPVLCRAREARHKGVCGVLDPGQLIQPSRHTNRSEVVPGTALLASGERTERHSNILSGVVTLSKPVPDGRQQIVGLQFAPPIFSAGPSPTAAR